MAENQIKNDIIDTTDCLEAVNTFNAMKNFLFIVILICMILVQAIFWVNKLGYVGTETCSSAIAAQPEKTELPDPDLPKEQSTPPVLGEEAKPEPAADVKTEAKEEAKETLDEVVKKAVGELDDETVVEDQTAGDEKSAKKRPAMPMPKAESLSIVIKICNFILVIAATLYSLTLLMCIKISLCGRLGGISHISKAFFASLFALVILLPWQALLPGVVVGAIYTPAELFTPAACPAVPGVVAEVIYYLRFSVMWLIVLLLIISSWSRSRKWSRTILKRLGILH